MEEELIVSEAHRLEEGALEAEVRGEGSIIPRTVHFSSRGRKPKRKRGRPANKKRGQIISKDIRDQFASSEDGSQSLASQCIRNLSINLDVDEMVGKIEKKKLLDVMSEQFNSGDVTEPAKAVLVKRRKKGGRGKHLKKESSPDEFLEPTSFTESSSIKTEVDDLPESPIIDEDSQEGCNDLELSELPKARGVKRVRPQSLETTLFSRTKCRVGSQSPATGKESPISESSNDSGNSRSRGRLRQAIAEEISSMSEFKQLSGAKRGRGRLSLPKSEHSESKTAGINPELIQAMKCIVRAPKKIEAEATGNLPQSILLKAIKKKKKHFKGLKYSFGIKKKKPKPKSTQSLLDSSQDNESLISEEVDADSFDSSSIETSSAQMSVGLDPYDPTEEFDDSHTEKPELSFHQHRRLHKEEEGTEERPVEEENMEVDEEPSWVYAEEEETGEGHEAYVEERYEQATEDMGEDYQEVNEFNNSQVEYAVETEEQEMLEEEEERLSEEEERPYEVDADISHEYGELLEEEYEEDDPIDYDLEGNEEAIANGIEYMNDTNEGIEEALAYENEHAEVEYEQLNEYSDEAPEDEVEVDYADEEQMDFDEQEQEFVEEHDEIDEDDQQNVSEDETEHAEECADSEEHNDDQMQDSYENNVDENNYFPPEQLEEETLQQTMPDEETLQEEDRDDETLQEEDPDDETLQEEDPDEETLQERDPDEKILQEGDPDEETLQGEDPDEEALQGEDPDEEALQEEDTDEEALQEEDPDEEALQGEDPDEETLQEEDPDEEVLQSDIPDEEDLRDENLNEGIVLQEHTTMENLQQENFNEGTVQEEHMTMENLQQEYFNEGTAQEEHMNEGGVLEEIIDEHINVGMIQEETLNPKPAEGYNDVEGTTIEVAKSLKKYKKSKKVKNKNYNRSAPKPSLDSIPGVGHKRKRSDDFSLIKSRKRILVDEEIVSYIHGEVDLSEDQVPSALSEPHKEDMDSYEDNEKCEDQSSDSSQQTGEKLSPVEEPGLGILAEEYSTDTSEASMILKADKNDGILRRVSKRRNGDSVPVDDRGESRRSKRSSAMSSSGVLTLAARSNGKSYPKLIEETDQDMANASLQHALCKCRVNLNPKAVNVTGEVYCQGFDCFDGRLIGCCNIIANDTYLRVSPKIPFMLLCNIHRQRLRRHNCCPGCGLFCTQGVFSECRWDTDGIRHYYHKLCGLLVNGVSLCPHCGTAQPPVEVHLELKLSRKPVIYLKQHQEKKGLISTARMTCPTLKASNDVATEEKNVPPDANHIALPNGSFISAVKLPIGLHRDRLEDAIQSIKAGKTFNIKASPKAIYWACKYDDLEKLLWVLVSGLSPNAKVREYGNQTGLHTASMYGSLASAHVLVLAGACFDLTDTQLLTPLMVAITKGHKDMGNYLIQAGANLHARTDDGMTCLHLAAKAGNYDSCRHILDSGRLSRHTINVQDEGGWTPLVWASENRCINVVKLLLERGADPQICDVEQNTALHWAAFSGSTHICSMVLERGCSLKSMNGIGDTPLHIAARQNHVEVVVQLLARGARLDVANKRCQSPLDCCLPDSQSFLHITLNKKLLDVMRDNGIRTERIMCSDIACGKEAVPITCVNGVDDEELPKNYVYISENCEALNVNIDRTISSLKWCECRDGCNTENCVCSQLNFQCWYDPEGKLLVDFNYADPPMIFECNRACGCNKLSCHNRVVQHGITAHMQLFRTDGKGWGVRALKDIAKGSYVCEYVGEIITDLEADQREDDSYLFDLDNRDTETYCIDARQYANIARFINHLCEPNLTPVKVFIDHQDLVFPRIAFFANRDIEADEELGFDYGEKFWVIKYKQFTCACGCERCKYSSDTIEATLEAYNKKNMLHQQDAPGVLDT